jgi:hypothetical protein
VLFTNGGGLYQTFLPLVQNDQGPAHTPDPQVVLDLAHQYQEKDMELYDWIHQPGGGTMLRQWILKGERRAIWETLKAEIEDVPVETLPSEARWFLLHCNCEEENAVTE